MKRIHVQIGTTLIGAVLLGWSIYNSIGVEQWGLWSAVAALGPAAVAIPLMLPGPVERTLDILAPKIPFLHDHGDDDGE